MGGSTDKSVDIIKKYEDRLAYWISEKDNGMYDGIAKGFSHATGEICAYINSDTAVPFRNLPVRIGSAYSNRLTLSREQSC